MSHAAVSLTAVAAHSTQVLRPPPKPLYGFWGCPYVHFCVFTRLDTRMCAYRNGVCACWSGYTTEHMCVSICVSWFPVTSKHSPHPAPFSYLKAHQVVPEKGINGPGLAPLCSSQCQYTYHAPESSPLTFSQTRQVSHWPTTSPDQ